MPHDSTVDATLSGRHLGEQAAGFVELELVAAAVLLGGAFDVGDPFAVLMSLWRERVR